MRRGSACPIDLHATAGRYAIVVAAIDAGLHVMLEKPPTATASELCAMTSLARERGVSPFTTWHSREAAGVAMANEWLRDKHVGNLIEKARAMSTCAR